MCSELTRKEGEYPDCADCVPELMPENIDSYKVYNRCKGQLILSFGGEVDLNLQAVKSVMDLYRIENQEKVLITVHGLYWHIRKLKDKKSG